MLRRTCALPLAALVAAGCFASTPASGPSTSTSTRLPGAAEPPLLIEGARVLPDIPVDAVPVSVEPDGTKRFLLQQMRLVEGPDGSLDAAPGVLPAGRSKLVTVELPSRFDGGFLIMASNPQSTQLWRADSWLSPLRPLVRLTVPTQDLVVGFDRVYLRNGRREDMLVAIDPEQGAWAELGALPKPMRYGPMLFADAWRAVIAVDVRGPMATFDAGATWIPLGIKEPVTAMSMAGQAIGIHTPIRSYGLSPEGGLAVLDADFTGPHKTAPSARAPAQETAGPRPLRLAIERGYPDTKSTALVAHEGNLLKVDARTGRATTVIDNAIPKSFTSCHGMQVGASVGFLCGEPMGSTSVFVFEPPRTLRRVLHWNVPRMVVPSGRGGLVARGPCPASSGPGEAGTTVYCVRAIDGASREVRFRGDLGAERIVPLSDGRIAILIAPRPGAEGRLVLLRGEQSSSVALTYPEVSRANQAVVHRGLWMQGMQEVAPNELGVWVEAAGQVVGVRIDAKGRVRVGEAQRIPGSILVSGRFGLAWKNTGIGLETTDGGMTWTEVPLPAGAASGRARVRGCSPVGCVHDGWMRVGWGKSTSDELEPTPKPEVTYPSGRPVLTAKLVCAPTGRASPAPLPVVAPSPPSVRRIPSAGRMVIGEDPARRGWQPFGPLAAPKLGSGDAGFSAGRTYGDHRYRAWSWGPKGGDWSQTGRWTVAFDDPFDATGRPRQSLPALPPWVDDSSAAVLISSITTAVRDPGGKALVVGWCRGPGQCTYMGMADGEPPVELPVQLVGYGGVHAAVRTSEAWYLLMRQEGSVTSLWRVEGSGNARQLRSYPRVSASRRDDLTLVRRALGDGVALLWRTWEGHGWLLMPINPLTGEIVEAVEPVPHDLQGRIPPRCSADEDGWLIETALPHGPELRLSDGSAFATDVRLRLRVNLGRACVEGLSARDRTRRLTEVKPQPAGFVDPAEVPLAVFDDSQDRKIEMVCRSAARAPGLELGQRIRESISNISELPD